MKHSHWWVNFHGEYCGQFKIVPIGQTDNFDDHGRVKIRDVRISEITRAGSSQVRKYSVIKQKSGNMYFPTCEFSGPLNPVLEVYITHFQIP